MTPERYNKVCHDPSNKLTLKEMKDGWGYCFEPYGYGFLFNINSSPECSTCSGKEECLKEIKWEFNL